MEREQDTQVHYEALRIISRSFPYWASSDLQDAKGEENLVSSLRLAHDHPHFRKGEIGTRECRFVLGQVLWAS